MHDLLHKVSRRFLQEVFRKSFQEATSSVTSEGWFSALLMLVRNGIMKVSFFVAFVKYMRVQ